MMNGVHDMGGMHGFGAIEIDEAAFHHEWEKRVRSMVVLTRDLGYFNIDAFRYGIESMDPSDYLTSSYFERWLATLQRNLDLAGLVEPDEFEDRLDRLLAEPDYQIPSWPEAAVPGVPSPVWMVPAPANGTNKFAAGDKVVVTNTHPETHTRKPRYVRGKRGVIGMVHGVATLPDSNAHGLGEHPEPLYSVQFTGRELWGDSAEPNQTLSLDLWESYLEPLEGPA
jgi:nitrile hydratase subunit beta